MATGEQYFSIRIAATGWNGCEAWKIYTFEHSCAISLNYYIFLQIVESYKTRGLTYYNDNMQENHSRPY